MAYAEPEDLIARFDERVIADLASDTGEPVADITSDTKVLAALDDASGRIDAACTVAEIYLESQLAALTGNSLALLKRLACQLAMAFLLGRRPEKYNDESITLAKKEAEEYLERLRRGERLFGLEPQQQAGKPTIDGPSMAQYIGLKMQRERVHNFYPRRQLPIGRGA